jgi:Flp pilus assembly pilin Flp
MITAITGNDGIGAKLTSIWTSIKTAITAA